MRPSDIPWLCWASISRPDLAERPLISFQISRVELVRQMVHYFGVLPFPLDWLLWPLSSLESLLELQAGLSSSHLECVSRLAGEARALELRLSKMSWCGKVLPYALQAWFGAAGSVRPEEKLGPKD